MHMDWGPRRSVMIRKFLLLDQFRPCATPYPRLENHYTGTWISLSVKEPEFNNSILKPHHIEP